MVDTSTLSSVHPATTSTVGTLHSGNIFQPIASLAPPAQISSRADHPVPRLGIQAQKQKLETNKFYSNFYLTSQTAPVFTYPYSVNWNQGSGNTGSWGLAVSHTERSQLATGPPKAGSDAGQWAYFINPIGISSLILSATQLTNGTTLTTDTLQAFSVNTNLIAPGASVPTIKFPVLQGMSFITGVYNSATPLIQSGVGFTNVTYAGAVVSGKVFKYRAMLQNGFTWLIYVSPSSSSYPANSFTLLNPVAVQGASGFNGYIQVAKLPGGATAAMESTYDQSAGAYPTAANITGAVNGNAGSYTLTWTKGGISTRPLLMFALPHHVESFSSATAASVTNLQLVTTTKGTGTAVRGNTWTLNEPSMPVSMGFAPWSPTQGSIKSVSQAAKDAINAAGLAELSQNISAQTNTGTTYYDGKALAKFAAIVYALHDIGGNTTLALTGLELLEEAFGLHVKNQMTWPLVFDSAWGGIVQSQTYVDGNSGDDFGNTYYNDHHFHYGYFVYTAAVIGYLDPKWLTTGTNKEWVNMLVRDYANPISTDPYYPFTRMFDWYHGHSWAAGLFESFDGKNQESSSEDTMASYGLKMWGMITGDQNMEARGNLMLAVQARSLQNYYLYLNNNTNEPAQFIGNKAAGILFDNKIDHTTYFGTNVEYIEGIHMLPLMPFSTLSRTPTFVQQEWDTYFSTYVNQVQGGWRGILMANYAIINPAASYAFFSNATGQFNMEYLDGGASQTWYLALSAALGGSSGTTTRSTTITNSQQAGSRLRRTAR